MPTNFWSFNFIDVKGLPLQFGSKTFTGFEIADLESWSGCFLLLLCSKKEENCIGSTFKISNFKDSKEFATKLKWQAQDKLNEQKLAGIADLPLSFPVISKRPFCYMAI